MNLTMEREEKKLRHLKRNGILLSANFHPVKCADVNLLGMLVKSRRALRAKIPPNSDTC